MGPTTVQTGFAFPTNHVDLAHHALTEPRFFVCLHNLTHELVTKDPSIWVVSFHQLEIGAAYSRLADADQYLAGTIRFGDVSK
jgi:hypothetical protein